MTDAERVAETKTFWEIMPPKWMSFTAGVMRAPEDIAFLIGAYEQVTALNRGLEDLVQNLREENARLRMAVKRWAEEEPVPEKPALKARVEETK